MDTRRPPAPLLTLWVDGRCRDTLGSSWVVVPHRYSPWSAAQSHWGLWGRSTGRLWLKQKPWGHRPGVVRLLLPFCMEAWPRLALSRSEEFLL